MRAGYGLSRSIREILMSKDTEMDKDRIEKTDLQRAAETFAKYRTNTMEFYRDYIQQAHNGPVIEDEEEEIEL